ncbi:hypothetical protein K466DRAFT_597824 [Polyporus arcularius HHB13444]|uniref:BTB domain-containing protein n=1 Tax=Polyporus arcularius HHB13444 TaxID=1314778 RepID=A0A5C3PKH5_9APHY|nr:hypothetical protein K466DRAFT_597824 [Polyporus arcularius HHB13444]
MHSNANQVHRDARLYFAEGDLVLRAAGSDGVHLFRVHKFLLKHHSMAFKDMFHAEDGSSSDTYDGVPVADLPGDRAEDLALLLTYLYNPSQLSFKRLDPNKPIELSGVIRLADKYLLEPLHDYLVQQVASDWPTTLQEWDIREAELQAIRKVAAEDKKKYWELVPEPVAAILFAKEFGCSQILPAAFYQLAQTNFNRDWNDETIQNDSWQWDTLLARWTMLEKDDLVRFLHGCQSVDDYYVVADSLVSEHCYPPWEHYEEGLENLCKTSKCYAFLAELVAVVWGRGARRNPLQLLLDCLEYEKYPQLSKERFPDGLCEHCRESLPEIIARKRKWVWDRLPEYFRLQ